MQTFDAGQRWKLAVISPPWSSRLRLPQKSRISFDRCASLLLRVRGDEGDVRSRTTRQDHCTYERHPRLTQTVGGSRANVRFCVSAAPQVAVRLLTVFGWGFP